MKNQILEVAIKMNGLMKKNGVKHVGKVFFLSENGLKWTYGFIQFGKIFPSV